jgi:hypothetical protein
MDDCWLLVTQNRAPSEVRWLCMQEKEPIHLLRGELQRLQLSYVERHRQRPAVV